MSMGGFFPRPTHSEEGEKPFWISYADLMTALMLLFLVIMIAALTAISKQSEELVKRAQQGDIQKPFPLLNYKDPSNTSPELRFQEISSLCDNLSKAATAANPNLNVDCKLSRINFGAVGRFDKDEYEMNAEGQAALAQLVPLVLDAANSPAGQKWLKQVLIEGYTDTDGSYLYNLDLSLKRSEWVMCTLLRNDAAAPLKFKPEQRRQVKKLFIPGGVAFNNIKDSKDASRRVEFRLQFYDHQAEKPTSPEYELKFDDNNRERCML